jgi:hypothetical protein
MKKQIRIGVGDAATTAKGFIDAWKKAEQGECLLTKYLLRDAKFYPAVAVTGPRQSGKTTLVISAFPRHAYVSLEETDSRTFAKEDPRGFLDRFKGPVVIHKLRCC